MNTAPLLELAHVSKEFGVGKRGLVGGHMRVLKAINDISFTLDAGETLALVGESGCGKTTTVRLILKLMEATAGQIRIDGVETADLVGPALREFRTKVQAVFQDPWASLNPRMRVADIVSEPLVVNERLTRKEVARRVDEALEAVGLDARQARQYPHEFSGGQRQRIAIASAIICRPRLIVLDEPVSALDVSVRSQIMNLFKDLQAQYCMAYVLVAHDLGTTRYMADKVAVMYLGRIVEYGPSEALFDAPAHPYTQALLSAALPCRPSVDQEEIVLQGEVPSPIDPPSGCVFHPRCHRMVGDICSATSPDPTPRAGRDHFAACHAK